MSIDDARPLVVGVTGAGLNTTALSFAAAQARREDCTVTLVHAVHRTLPPPPPSVLLTYASLDEVANRVVREVREEFLQLSGGGVACTSLTRSGGPVEVLVDLSAGARLVILQHRDLSRLTRIVVASTANRVAAHAHCPVVSVPEAWQSATEVTRVTVGVLEEGAPREALEAAFSAAAERGCPLRVFHAWRLDSPYEAMVSDVLAEQWCLQQGEAVAHALRTVQARYPGVAVETVVRHEWPADALVEESSRSDLLVLGRRSRHRPLSERLGSIASILIRESRCPVMVVPVTE